MKRLILFPVCIALLGLSSCISNMDVFEKNVSMPEQHWDSNFKPEITFSITDTSALYDVYVVLRHTDAYNYSNIWIQATVQQPAEKDLKKQQYDLLLATNEKGWLGSAMDDIYEQRVLIQPQTRFKKQGEYHFTIEELMREDPLKHILNVGLRVEKIR